MHLGQPELGRIAPQARDPKVGCNGELPTAFRLLRLRRGRKERRDVGGVGERGR
ncbi:hypothetical protein D3C87_1891280 [compost metagenome]